MPVTTLDPVTALIVIDLQKGIAAYPTVHPLEEIVPRAAALAEAFRAHGLPVVLVTAVGRAPGRTEQPRGGRDLPPGWAELLPGLNQQPGDVLIEKRTPGAFTSIGLAERLATRGVTQVVVAGVATSNGVEATARQAYELGLNVTLATDAMTDISAEAHENSIARIFPRLGETGTAADILALMPSRAKA